MAWILFDENGIELAHNDIIIKPNGFEIPTVASDLHSITTEKANAEGIEIIHTLTQFDKQVNKEKTIVRHNMAFDEKVLGAELLRAGMQNTLESKNKICTMLKTIKFVGIKNKFGYKWPKLSELHQKLFGYDFEDAHNANADIYATAKCFWELKKRNIL